MFTLVHKSFNNILPPSNSSRYFHAIQFRNQNKILKFHHSSNVSPSLGSFQYPFSYPYFRSYTSFSPSKNIPNHPKSYLTSLSTNQIDLRPKSHHFKKDNLRLLSTLSHSHLYCPSHTVPKTSNNIKPSNTNPELKVGQVLNGYRVEIIQPILERNLLVYELVHLTTGARHVHIASDDVENVFAVTFKTIPTDNMGTAHILEHLSLCGSKKYPVRDPFFNMLKRSLSTYMNAWTGSDFTSYPFSTTNEKDYYNLLSVYLDAAFHPKLEYLDFLQEGHRLELNQINLNHNETKLNQINDNNNDIDNELNQTNNNNESNPINNNNQIESELEHKGVVYNEMKGAMSESNDLFLYELYKHLYPTSTYHYNSGGDPSAIRQIEHQHVLDFHHQFCRPSNAFFFTYGSFPLQPQLEFISKEILDSFEMEGKDAIGKMKTQINPEIRFESPRRIQCFGPRSSLIESHRQCKISISWLTHLNHQDYYLLFIMNITSYLMMNGPNSPFYKALISSNIGQSYSPGSGFDSSNYDTCFSIGLSNIDEKDIDRVESIILETMEKVSNEGFPMERIEALLHQIEYSQKHVTTGFGLQLFSSMTHGWIHGASPSKSLVLEPYLTQLRSDLKENKPIFQQITQDQLLNNPHRLTLIMLPNDQYMLSLQEEESKSLSNLMNEIYSMDKGPETRKRLKKDAEDLAKRQAQKDDLSILPKIDLDQIDRLLKPVNIETRYLKCSIPLEDLETFPIYPIIKEESIQKLEKIEKIENLNIPVHWITQPTNGLVYFRALLDITDNIPPELLNYIPLLISTISKMGTEKYDYHQLSQRKELVTGSFSLSERIVQSPYISSSPKYDDPYHLDIALYSSCLNQNIDAMFELWHQVLIYPDFSNLERLKTILGSLINSMHSSIISSGHGYARMLAGSRLLPSALQSEAWHGLSQFNLLRQYEIDLNDGKSLSFLAQKLQKLSAYLLNSSKLKIAIHAQDCDTNIIEKPLESLLSSIHSNKNEKRGINKIISNECKINNSEEIIQGDLKPVYIGIPSQINFVTMVSPSVPYNHPDYSKLDILSLLLSSNFLHKEIRERGGAYGGGLTQSGGLLGFYSYSDPHVIETLDIFNQSIRWVLDNQFSDQNIEEAKLQLISVLDSPLSPSQKGLEWFESGIDLEMRQNRRNRAFNVNRQDLIQVCHKYLYPIIDHDGNNEDIDCKQNRGKKSIVVLGSNQNELFKVSPDWDYREQ